MTSKRQIAGITISSGWVLVLVVPIVAVALWAAIDHANANQKRERQRSDARVEQKFRQALAVTERKFQQALRVAVYSTNKSVCGLRGFAQPGIDRAIAARETYDQLTPAQRARNELAIRQGQAFLRTQVTVPSTFDCATLPKKPPKATS